MDGYISVNCRVEDDIGIEKIYIQCITYYFTGNQILKMSKLWLHKPKIKSSIKFLKRMVKGNSEGAGDIYKSDGRSCSQPGHSMQLGFMDRMGRMKSHLETQLICMWKMLSCPMKPKFNILAMAQSHRFGRNPTLHPHCEARWWKHHVVGMLFISREWETEQGWGWDR